MANNENKTAESKTYKQQAGEYYNKQYNSWMPWMEDKYLQWFTKDNKASYATKRMSSHIPLPPNPSIYLPPLTSLTPSKKTSTKPKSPASPKSTTCKTACTGWSAAP
jgi:hypothetical protein